MLPEEGTVSISEIEQKIKRVIARYAMLPSGCTVVVGFSGGADSAALTHFLFFAPGRIWRLGCGRACQPWTCARRRP